VDTLLSVVLVNAVGAAVLAVPAAVLDRLRRWPALTHSLWLLVLLKLITPPLYVVPLPALRDSAETEHGASPSPESSAVELRKTLGQSGTSEIPADRGEMDPLPLALVWNPRDDSNDLAPATSEGLQTAPTLPSISWRTVAVLLLVLGCACCWMLLALRLWHFGRVLRHVHPAPDVVQGLARCLAGRLGLQRPPEVSLVQAPISPLVWGLTSRPRVLLPAVLWQRLSEPQRESLLVHELAHLRRRDHWVRILELLVISLYWWHPVVWWARGRVRQAEEQCCDAWVIWAFPDRAEEYASALLETVSFLSRQRTPLPVGASGMAGVASIKRRLTMILRDRAPRGLTRGGLLAVCVLAAFLLPLAATPAEPQSGGNGQTQTTKAEGPHSEPGRAVAAEPAVQDPLRGVTPAATIPAQRANEFSGKQPPSTVSGKRMSGQAGEELGPKHPQAREEIQRLRDQIELMEAQLQVKNLQVEVARKRMAHSKREVDRLAKLAELKAISTEELGGARDRYESAELEVKIKVAELREPMILLEQARRRLATLSGQERPNSPPEGSTGPASEGFFPKSRVDFGRVPQGPPVVHNFAVMNPTNSGVWFRSVRSSSAAVKATAEPTELAPGQTGKVTLTVDTHRFTGPKEFTIFITLEKLGPISEGSKEVQSKLTLRMDSQPAVPTPTTFAPPTSEASRVRELERKLDRLLKEMDDLRKELKSRGPARNTTGPNDPAASSGPQQFLAIPFQLEPSRKQGIAQLLLYHSRDEGRSWRQVDSAPPTAKEFRVRRPRDAGTHWFAVAVQDLEGRRTPSDPANLRPDLKLDVREAAQPDSKLDDREVGK
jgi:beta-lactamase regulating signal transducer with metallopeptidase domain